MTNAHSPKSRDGVEQDQFLTVLSREDALARFEAALFPRAVPSEPRALADALGCALAHDIVAPIDVPPFDRSNVDGFAVRSADLAPAGEATPVRVMLNDEIIACGTARKSDEPYEWQKEYALPQQIRAHIKPIKGTNNGEGGLNDSQNGNENQQGRSTLHGFTSYPFTSAPKFTSRIFRRSCEGKITDA
jgi:hypothetical protein